MKFEQIVKPDQWILSQTFTVKVEEIPQVIELEWQHFF